MMNVPFIVLICALPTSKQKCYSSALCLMKVHRFIADEIVATTAAVLTAATIIAAITTSDHPWRLSVICSLFLKYHPSHTT